MSGMKHMLPSWVFCGGNFICSLHSIPRGIKVPWRKGSSWETIWLSFSHSSAAESECYLLKQLQLLSCQSYVFFFLDL